MIEDFETVEVWRPRHLAQIPKRFNRSYTDLCHLYHEVYNDQRKLFKLINIQANWRNIIKNPNKSYQFRTTVTLSEVSLKLFQHFNMKPYPQRERVIIPNKIKQTLKERDLTHIDLIYDMNQYSSSNITSWVMGKSMPSLDFLVDLTKLLSDEDISLLDLPPNQGVRWNMDEWIRTSSIPVKQSWEEARD